MAVRLLLLVDSSQPAWRSSTVRARRQHDGKFWHAFDNRSPGDGAPGGGLGAGDGAGAAGRWAAGRRGRRQAWGRRRWWPWRWTTAVDDDDRVRGWRRHSKQVHAGRPDGGVAGAGLVAGADGHADPR